MSEALTPEEALQDRALDVAGQLVDLYGEGEDGFDVWHERGGNVCLASKGKVSVMRGALRFTMGVEWYLKLCPMGKEHFDHGWQVLVCYRVEGASGYVHALTWMPADTHASDLAIVAGNQRRIIEEALETALRYG